MSSLIRYLTLYFSLLFLAVFSLYVVHLIPTSSLKSQLEKSLPTFQKEGIYPSYGLYPRPIVLDNYTDSLMLNTAYYQESPPLKAALLNERLVVSAKESDQIKNLVAAYKDQGQTATYQRYWHGYLVWLRPLLTVFTYAQIRAVMQLSLYTVFTFLVYLAYKKRGWAVSSALLLSALAVDFFFIGVSMQFVAVFLIGILAACYLLKKGSPQNEKVIFATTGMLSAFFDLLTAPVVSLGWLLFVSPSRKVSSLIKNCLSWAVGYSVFWFSKWALVELLYGTGALSDAWHHVVNRTVTQADTNFSKGQAILLNVYQLIGYAKASKILVAMLVLGALVSLIIFHHRKLNKSKRRNIIYWMLVAVIPYAWYLVAANHSYLHVWFTYRAQLLTVGGLFLIYTELISWQKVSQAVSKLKSYLAK